MPAITISTEPAPPEVIAVILTGSTGSLGSYLLDSLARQQQVRKIYCLNRAEDGGLAKQKIASHDRGLDVAAWGAEDRVEFLHVDLSQPLFGLTGKKYRELLRETTHIIHNQYPVNFNWSLTSFEPSIRGVRHLLDFCSDAPAPVEFLFLSTIGSVGQVKPSTPLGKIEERPNHELSPLLSGYCASKLICELIIEEHVRSSSSPERGGKMAVCRVGQIVGPVLRGNVGGWNRAEWLPAIIESSKYMGLLPSSLGALDIVNWVPVDVLSEIVLELAGLVDKKTPLPDKASSSSSPSSEVTIYHAVNPHNVNWDALVPTVADLLSIEPSNIVPWGQWVDSLRLSGKGVAGEGETAGSESSNLEKNPGLKLLDFFGSLGSGIVGKGKAESTPLLATDRTAAKSKMLAALQPVGTEWMSLWVKQLGF